VAVSVSLMNLLCCPLGGMPMCHGSGGLAAQYRFGARTGGSIVMLGGAKILLALLFGGSLLVWMRSYPQSVLGVLLLFAGLELVLVCRDQGRRSDFWVMALTGGVCLAVNTAAGFVVGLVVARLLAWRVFHVSSENGNGG
jgi:SulP family sulfate permease